MLENMKKAYEDALKNGYRGARGTGEMLWGTRKIKGVEKLMEYESRINIMTRTHPFTAVCWYDARECDVATIRECLKVHPYLIVKGNVVMNPYFIPPEEYLKNYS